MTKDEEKRERFIWHCQSQISQAYPKAAKHRKSDKHLEKYTKKSFDRYRSPLQTGSEF